MKTAEMGPHVEQLELDFPETELPVLKESIQVVHDSIGTYSHVSTPGSPLMTVSEDHEIPKCT